MSPRTRVPEGRGQWTNIADAGHVVRRTRCAQCGEGGRRVDHPLEEYPESSRVAAAPRAFTVRGIRGCSPKARMALHVSAPPRFTWNVPVSKRAPLRCAVEAHAVAAMHDYVSAVGSGGGHARAGQADCGTPSGAGWIGEESKVRRALGGERDTEELLTSTRHLSVVSEERCITRRVRRLRAVTVRAWCARLRPVNQSSSRPPGPGRRRPAAHPRLPQPSVPSRAAPGPRCTSRR